MESENYKNIKKDTPLEIQVKVLEDITAKQQAYIDKLEKKLKLYDVSNQRELLKAYEQANNPCDCDSCKETANERIEKYLSL